MSQCCNSGVRRQLHFLLVKTVAVRNGVKPGELLRLSSCYRTGAECVELERVLRALEIGHVILERNAESALVLFYNPEALGAVLAAEETKRFLASYGYAEDLTCDEALAHLAARFTGG